MADKTISELVAATQVQPNDLFVLEQNNTAKKLTGQILENWLVSFADGHGGIQSIAKTGTSGLVDTYTITLADTTTFTFTVTNGEKGDTGAQTYVWIKWAAQNPTADNQLSDIPDAWIGIYSGAADTAPTTRASYQWYEYKGEKGDTGDTGASIATIARTSGDGSPGTYDTYTVTLDTGTVAGTFQVYNGLNGTGAVNSVAGVNPDASGNVRLTASDVGALPDNTPIPAASTSNPQPPGTADPGMSTTYARGDHVHPEATEYDSGWMALTQNAEGNVFYRRLGNIVFVIANDILSAPSSSVDPKIIGTLPLGFRPDMTSVPALFGERKILITGVGSSSNAQIRANITSDGVVSLSYASPNESYSINTSFPTADEIQT